MSDVTHGFGGYVVVSMSRAFDHLDVVVAKNLLQMPVYNQDHFVAFAQGVRVTPSQMEGFRADVERLSAEYRAEPLTTEAGMCACCALSGRRRRRRVCLTITLDFLR